MSISVFQVDSFTDRPFAGNPAAVCLLESAPSVSWMQQVAAEMNLSETAFVRPIDDGFELRWFTPTVEVDLCGHATLAAAFVLWESGRAAIHQDIQFQTRSGLLHCRRSGDAIEMDFPALPISPAKPPLALCESLGIQPEFTGQSRFDWLMAVASDEVVRRIQPDFHALRAMTGLRGVIVTGPSHDSRYDFVSRFFAPGAGIDEDPVTGSAHCSLAPYWGSVLHKTEMTGFQASPRGGTVRVRTLGERVFLIGHAVMIVRGELVME